MAAADDLPYTTVETCWVPLRDGRRLAARLFLPADGRPAPLILEYIPYRRRDGTRLRDDEMHGWFAANGFACARLDIAGSGDSDGLIEDEYVRREQDDVLEAIEYLCTRPWCSGTAGMIGISWGGFSGLQAAARGPSRLKAVITACSTDDRFACDAHYSGGCVIADNVAGWGGVFFPYAALPPDPQVVGADRWRKMWLDRIEAVEVYPAKWLRHQRKDAYWKHGSVSEDWSRIGCAVMAVGGWLDGYTQTIFRLVENLPAGRVWGLCGPWGHQWPQQGVPGPAIGFLQECKRFFDRWLRDGESGAGHDPAMRLFIMDPAPPAPFHAERPGRWVAFPDWPPAPGVITTRRLHLGPQVLAGAPGQGAPLSFASPLTTGIAGQEWCPYGIGTVAAESALDQRGDDAGSLCFDSAPLEADIDILGEGMLTLRLASDRPQAQVAARLNAVAPDGTSALVTFALLNLSHRDGSEAPAPMHPGRFEDITIRLKPVGQKVPAGHRLRLALSTSYWPMAWPVAEAATLTVDPAASHLDLPLLADEAGLPGVAFAAAESAPAGPTTEIRPGRIERRFVHDLPAQVTRLEVVQDAGSWTFDDIATGCTSTLAKEFAIGWDDPLSCRATITFTEARSRPDWNPRLETEVTTRADATAFRVTARLRAWDGDELIAERDHDETIPRDCM